MPHHDPCVTIFKHSSVARWLECSTISPGWTTSAPECLPAARRPPESVALVGARNQRDGMYACQTGMIISLAPHLSQRPSEAGTTTGRSARSAVASGQRLNHGKAVRTNGKAVDVVRRSLTHRRRVLPLQAQLSEKAHDPARQHGRETCSDSWHVDGRLLRRWRRQRRQPAEILRVQRSSARAAPPFGGGCFSPSQAARPRRPPALAAGGSFPPAVQTVVKPSNCETFQQIQQLLE